MSEKTRKPKKRKESPKILVSMRYDPEIIEHFKAAGPGWQTRIMETLKVAIKKGIA